MTQTEFTLTAIALLKTDIQNQIYQIIGLKVMLDRGSFILYDVITKQLKRQVKRNIERSLDNFIFELTDDEHRFLRSQIISLRKDRHSKYQSVVYIEQRIATLPNVLNSERAMIHLSTNQPRNSKCI
jgi:ORF6N domain.